MDEVQEKKTVSVCYTPSSRPYSVELLTLGCYRNKFVLLNTRNKMWLLLQVVKLKWVEILEGQSQKRIWCMCVRASYMNLTRDTHLMQQFIYYYKQLYTTYTSAQDYTPAPQNLSHNT